MAKGSDRKWWRGQGRGWRGEGAIRDGASEQITRGTRLTAVHPALFYLERISWEHRGWNGRKNKDTAQNIPSLKFLRKNSSWIFWEIQVIAKKILKILPIFCLFLYIWRTFLVNVKISFTVSEHFITHHFDHFFKHDLKNLYELRFRKPLRTFEDENAPKVRKWKLKPHQLLPEAENTEHRN